MITGKVQRHASLTTYRNRQVMSVDLYRCKWCCKFYKTHVALKGHWTRKIGGWDNKPRSKLGTGAEKAVKRAKMVKMHKAADKVMLTGRELKTGVNLGYLGFVFQADGGWRYAVDDCKDGTGKDKVWKDTSHLELKDSVNGGETALYSCAVVPVLVYRSEAWTLTSRQIKALDDWNSRCLHIITDRGYKEKQWIQVSTWLSR